MLVRMQSHNLRRLRAKRAALRSPRLSLPPPLGPNVAFYSEQQLRGQLSSLVPG